MKPRKAVLAYLVPGLLLAVFLSVTNYVTLSHAGTVIQDTSGHINNGPGQEQIETTLFSENFDSVTPPTLPAGWTAANAIGPAPLWETSNSGLPAPAADSPPNSAFIDDPLGVVSDKMLDSPSVVIPNSPTCLSFANDYVLDSESDGGVLEISIGGGDFEDIITAGGSFLTGGYNATISTAFGNPIAGRMAWTNNSPNFDFITTRVNLPASSAGQSIILRWRMGSDHLISTSSYGWRIDSVRITDGACNFRGITLAPRVATNLVGENHTVTATVTDPIGNPQSGILVTFTILSGPNAGASGTCNPSDCTTDANGHVSFTYTGSGGVGTDVIQACFTPSGEGAPTCSQPVTKTWIIPTTPSPTPIGTATPTPTSTATAAPTATATPVRTPTPSPVPGGCVVSHGYWQNHPEAWCMETIQVGCQTYTQSQVLAIIRHSTGQDKTYLLAQELAAAKLNVTCKNSNQSCVSRLIAQADAWLCLHPVGSGVGGGSVWNQIKSVQAALEKYNTGRSCAPACPTR